MQRGLCGAADRSDDIGDRNENPAPNVRPKIFWVPMTYVEPHCRTIWQWGGMDVAPPVMACRWLDTGRVGTRPCPGSGVGQPDLAGINQHFQHDRGAALLRLRFGVPAAIGDEFAARIMG